MSKNKVTKSISKDTEGSSGGSVPEFIQKLFRMLENKAFKDVFCWSTDGTTFIVKDTNEFSKSILPKHFKHCNFASFVRQLNKYDFHKIRNTDDGQRPYGDQAWEFVHPKFMRDRKDLLEDIKRKVPGNKYKIVANKEEIPNVSQSIVNPVTVKESSSLLNIQKISMNLQSQIDQLKKSRAAMENNIEKLKQTDEHIMIELANFSKTLIEKDKIIQDFLKLIADNEKQSASSSNNNNNRQSRAQIILESYSRISQSNAERMNKLNELLGIKKEPPLIHKSILQIQQQEMKQPQHNLSLSADPETVSAAAAAASMNAGSLIGSPLKTAEGLTFVTLGRLSSNMAVRDNKPAIEIMAADQTSTFPTYTSISTATAATAAATASAATAAAAATATSTSTSTPINTTGIKRKSPSSLSSSTSSPLSSSQVSWTVPPRILLVDDDSVYRDLSGKLLQVIGCTIDLAKDGVEALKKMGLEKYDLILMDIVMPKMDGISATRSIRQYDALTPIISMTSNFTDNDIMQYIGSGMTDILPKPFSKRTLYQMLEKYCAHLKAIQRVQGLEPPISQDNMNLLQQSGGNIIGSSSIINTSSPASSSSSSSPSLSSSSSPSSTIPLQQQAPSYHNTLSATATQNTFPLAPYPYPVTMNSVPINATLNNMTNNDISNVTFWPQQPPQQQNPPPAIIPNNDGKFIWAVPTTNIIPVTTQQKQQSASFETVTADKRPRHE
ncbi:uncharacterized protein BX663DRAFT_485207 [Cokeromyces recurvatus]|uniref:uncharacterized protein n=1 Tax=Cokeromyces recurvatus TaxID=90255 RepID=UPI002220C3B1|nr:uncharacterized protein BX663DRAFT_485207 [Cokeromyces recurvatus]KAI7904389.1 hypothetical protein BX663DRAFT_485207 [Cokeromyces recurvatus]